MAALIHTDSRIVDRRLRQYFNSTRSQWVEIVKAAVAARAGCTDNDAKAAPGFYAWNAATAESRRIFLKEGWQRGDQDGIETIINSERGKVVAIMNADSGTCDEFRSPRNRTVKGPASEKVVDLNNQGELFRREEMFEPGLPQSSLWYLCVYDNGEKVRAEISRPIEYQGGYVVKYSERIFILREGDWEKVIVEDGARDQGQDFEIDVRRK